MNFLNLFWKSNQTLKCLKYWEKKALVVIWKEDFRIGANRLFHYAAEWAEKYMNFLPFQLYQKSFKVLI